MRDAGRGPRPRKLARELSDRGTAPQPLAAAAARRRSPSTHAPRAAWSTSTARQLPRLPIRRWPKRCAAPPRGADERRASTPATDRGRRRGAVAGRRGRRYDRRSGRGFRSGASHGGFGMGESIHGGCTTSAARRGRVHARRRHPRHPALAGMITVAIVDDHPLYRQGLARAVEQADGLDARRPRPNPSSIRRRRRRRRCRAARPAPARASEGAEGRGARRARKGHRVIVVSAAGAPDDVIDAVAAGADGYLTKDADADDIHRAVRAVAGGQTYVSPTLASYLISANRQKSDRAGASAQPARARDPGARRVRRDRPRHRQAAVHRHRHGVLAPRAHPRQDRCPPPGPADPALPRGPGQEAASRPGRWLRNRSACNTNLPNTTRSLADRAGRSCSAARPPASRSGAASPRCPRRRPRPGRRAPASPA